MLMDVSIVIPLLDEEESLPELINWLQKVLQDNGYDYEIILIDDGSRDNSWSVTKSLSEIDKNIRGIKFRRNYGKSSALNVGFSKAKGDVVITMDADLQDSPDEIPFLYNMIKEGGYDLVSGWKQKRHDPLSKTVPSKFFNSITRFFTGIKLNDFNCGLKAYKNRVVKSIDVYGDMHRYIPVLAKWAGFNRIGERIVQHQERKYGSSKFGLSRSVGILDVLSISFMSRFGEKPMHFFGSLGVLAFIFGFGILFYLSLSKVFYSTYGMTERPLFFFGVILILIGSQLFLTGFLADMMIRNSSSRNSYQIEEDF